MGEQSAAEKTGDYVCEQIERASWNHRLNKEPGVTVNLTYIQEGVFNLSIYWTMRPWWNLWVKQTFVTNLDHTYIRDNGYVMSGNLIFHKLRDMYYDSRPKWIKRVGTWFQRSTSSKP